MDKRLSEYEFDLYLSLLVKAMRGVRSTLRLTYPDYVAAVTSVIEMPCQTRDELQLFLHKAHSLAIKGRHDVYSRDPEASNLFDAIHNIPSGLLGRFEEGWDWREPLPEVLREHETFYLGGLKKYSGMLPPSSTTNNSIA
ncbi:MAG: hypothetical protein AAGC55_15940 [Myxococcota bacterium]